VALACLAVRLRPWIVWSVTALLSVWNLLLIANFTYVIRVDRDMGYLGLVAGQLQAIRYLPHLFVQGQVVRALVARHAVANPPSVGAGLSLLALELVVLVIAAGVSGWQREWWFRPQRRVGLGLS